MTEPQSNTMARRWAEIHGEYPLLVIARKGRHPTTHRTAVLCLDCAKGGEAIYAGEDEPSTCDVCERPVRHARAFGSESEATEAC